VFVYLILKTALIKEKNKLGLQNYAIITPFVGSCIKLNNNRINSLQRYDTTQSYRMVQFITSKFLTAAIFKSSSKESNDLYETCRYVYDLSLHKTSYILNATVHELSP
jgi:hypothetical protein